MLIKSSHMTSIEFRQNILSTPFCPICQKPVPLENAKTDERGQAIHEECYIRGLQIKLQTTGENATMTREEIEKMENLCRLIQVERDPKKFDALVADLNELLDEKGHRLKRPADPAHSR